MFSGRQIEEFIAVAEEGSISKAAERLYISQPALSLQMKDLETELGFKLFDRGKTGIALTEAGTAFLEDMRREMVHLEAAVSRAKTIAGCGKTRLAIGGITGNEFGIYSRELTKFHLKYPDVDIDLKLIPFLMQGRVEKLRDGSIDLFGCGYRDTSKLPELDYFPIREDQDCLLMSKDDILAGKTAITIDDLDNKTVLVPYEGTKSPGKTTWEKLAQSNPLVKIEKVNIGEEAIADLQYNDKLMLILGSHGRQIKELAMVPLAVQYERSYVGFAYLKGGSQMIARFLECFEQDTQPDRGKLESAAEKGVLSGAEHAEPFATEAEAMEFIADNSDRMLDEAR